MSQARGIKDKAWEATQIKVFSRWCAKYLKERHIDFESVETDFADGVKLCNLLEIIGKEPIKKKWHKEVKPGIKAKYESIENCAAAIDYITTVKGITLVGVHDSDIVDKNIKLTLGLTWSCINKFQIEDISVEEKTARDALLLWCKKNTQGYEDVNVSNFTSSWNTCLAFCALINKFRPKLLDYSALDRADHNTACTKAFDACRELGITVFLDPEDIVDILPDEKSVVTQVSEFFHFFAAESKIGAMVDRVNRTLEVQHQLDEFKSNYAQEAKATLDEIAKNEAEINDDGFDKQSVPAYRNKLSDVIKFGRIGRPTIVDLRSKALKTWNGWVTKCKSTNRPPPVAPEGLEPELLTKNLEELDNTQSTRRAQLTEELKALEQSLIDKFDQGCTAVATQISEIHSGSLKLNGPLVDQRKQLEEYLAQAQGFNDQLAPLQEQFDQLCDLKLNTRAKYTMFSMRSDISQLISHLEHLLEQNQADLIAEEHEARIAAYNEKATVFNDEAVAFTEAVTAISNNSSLELRDQRNQLVEKLAELSEKREKSQDTLLPPYTDLENDNLHVGVKFTPIYISSIYGGTLTDINKKLKQIYDEMVQKYDALAVPIVEKIRAKEAESDALPEDLQQRKGLLEGLLNECTEIQSGLDVLDAPFEELTEFKINYEAKFTPKDAHNFHEQLEGHLKHLIQRNDGAIYQEECNRRIKEYTDQATQMMTSAKEIENEIEATGGQLEEKRQALFKIQNKVSDKLGEVETLVPVYNALEEDNLHLHIEDSPSSIKTYFENINGHITTIIGQIDAAIAMQKGLEISEEQLAEFRETFAAFDKDNSRTLVNYELYACLTALGDPSSEQECDKIIKKYCGEAATSMDFENYCKFMLDRFTKTESADSTKDAFNAIAQNSPIVTEEQLLKYFKPEEVEYMKGQMQEVEGGYDFKSWVDSIYIH